MNFIGANYDGQKTTDEHRFDGFGQYTFANGDVYVGGMKDGAFDGHGILFFRTARKEAKPTAQGEPSSLKNFLAGAGHETAKTPSTITESGDAANAEEASSWAGHYRGFWKNGEHVWGSYVFHDGLVYGSQPTGPASAKTTATTTTTTTTGAATTTTTASAAATALDRTSTSFWAYCQSDDHRLWSEHLRHLQPVFACETVLGGAKVNADAIAARDAAAGHGATQPLWVDMPMLVPSSRLATLTPPSFAQGQPRSGADIVPGWWEAGGGSSSQTTRPSTANPNEAAPRRTPDETNANVSAPPTTTTATAAGSVPGNLPAIMALPTPPLLPEQDPDQILHADGTVEVRSRKVDEPTLIPRFTEVDTLLRTGGRVLASQPCTRAQAVAVAAVATRPVPHAETATSRPPVTWASKGTMAAIAARPSTTVPAASSRPPQVAASSAAAASASPSARAQPGVNSASPVSTSAAAATAGGGRAHSPRPPSQQRPGTGNSSSGRAQQVQRQRAASPTPLTPPAPTLASSAVPVMIVVTSERPTSASYDKSYDEANGLGGGPQQDSDAFFSAPPPEVANNRTQRGFAQDDEEDDTTNNSSDHNKGHLGVATEAMPDLPSMEVPLIVVDTAPKVCQLSTDSDDDEYQDAQQQQQEEEGDDAEAPHPHLKEAASEDVDVDVDGEAALQEHAATTLQGFARMIQARRARDARHEAIQVRLGLHNEPQDEEAYEEDGGYAEDDDGAGPFAMDDEGGWVEEAEYDSNDGEL